MKTDLHNSSLGVRGNKKPFSVMVRKVFCMFTYILYSATLSPLIIDQKEHD